MSTELKSFLTTNLPEIQTAVTNFVDYADILNTKLNQFLESTHAIGEITNKEKRNRLSAEIIAFKKVLKEFEQLRLNVTRKIDELKNLYIAKERNITGEPYLILGNLEAILVKFDRDEENKRQEELRKQQETIVAANKQAEILAENQRKLKEVEINLINLISNLANIKTLEEKALIETKFNNFLAWAVKHEQTIINIGFEQVFKNRSAEFRAAFQNVDKQIEIFNSSNEAEKKRLAEEAAEAQRKAAIDIENANRAAALIEAEQEESNFENQKAQIDNLKKIQDEKLKNINLGFEIEIEDIDLVPDHLVKKELKLKETKSEIRNLGCKIPGLKVKLKDGTYLSDDEYVILLKK